MNSTVRILLLGFFVSLLFFSTCKDDNPVSEVQQDENNQNEPILAFPGQTGEITEIISDGDTLTVEKFGNLFVYQGDILINPDDLRKQNPRPSYFAISWPNNTLPYEFSSDASKKFKEIVQEGIKLITEISDVRIEERDSETSYVIFTPLDLDGVAGSSYVGNQRGMKGQAINIGNSVSPITVAHEIMHALGFWHEHSRADRDDYVIINEENIENEKDHAFTKKRGYSPETPYDYNSIMHYGSFDFSIDKPNWPFDKGKPTITKLDGSIIESNRDNISSYDIDKIYELYPELVEPTIETSSITSITRKSAKSGGTVLNNGGAEVSNRGVCWSTTQSPTVNDNCTLDGAGTGSFTSEITGLSSNTKYYVQAYATNSVGTGYGDQKSFTTKEPENREPNVKIVQGPKNGSTIDYANPTFEWEGSDSDGSIDEYKVELNGPDADEKDTKETQYTANNLSSGEYTFRVRAIDNDGAASSWASRDFIVSVGYPNLSISPSSFDLEAEAGTRVLKIENEGGGTLEWEASVNAGWLELSDAEGTGEMDLEIEFEANNKTKDRNAEIEITSNGGIATIEIRQHGLQPPELDVIPNSLNVGPASTTKTLEIENDGEGTLEWEASESVGWIKLSKTSDSGEATINVKINANTSPNQRSAEIEITSNGGNVTVEVTQSGEAQPSLSVNPSSFDVGSGSTTESLNIGNAGEGTLEWEASESVGWIELSKTSDSGEATIN
ncbi:MAG: hypothetical protein GVY20_13090, partial [Bacteroidetes bacterium]|nr:hypothetical protein [Bacteroidota bacterium]